MSQFEQFEQCLESNSVETALELLAEYFTGQKRFHELFEVRKVQLRYQLNLPVREWQSLDDLPGETAQALESGLLAACREVGCHLMKQGEVAQGWQYLQPVGDRGLVRELIHETELTDENVEPIIEIAIGHMVDPAFGFKVVIDRYGTCSAITAFESQLMPHPLPLRRSAANILVAHVYEELSQRVGDNIREREGAGIENASLAEMMQGRPWLFEGLSHHIDTTHLASTVKAARCLTDTDAIDKAIELAKYGSQLHEDFQYQDESPFERIYQDVLLFLTALRGQSVDQALDYFRDKASEGIENRNLDPAQWYVYLLDRLDRGEEAWRAMCDFILSNEKDGMISQPIAPDYYQLARKYGLYQDAKQSLLKAGDLLNFAVLSVAERQSAKGKRPLQAPADTAHKSG